MSKWLCTNLTMTNPDQIPINYSQKGLGFIYRLAQVGSAASLLSSWSTGGWLSKFSSFVNLLLKELWLLLSAALIGRIIFDCWSHFNERGSKPLLYNFVLVLWLSQTTFLGDNVQDNVIILIEPKTPKLAHKQYSPPPPTWSTPASCPGGDASGSHAGRRQGGEGHLGDEREDAILKVNIAAVKNMK